MKSLENYMFNISCRIINDLVLDHNVQESYNL